MKNATLLRVALLLGALSLSVGCGSGGSSGAKAGTSAGAGGAASGTGGGSGSGSGASTGGVPAAPEHGVVVVPGKARTSYGGKVQLMALVGGLSDKTVTWSVTEGDSGGSVSAEGVYTAPMSSGTFHVVATANGDESLKGTSEVSVSAEAGTPPKLEVGKWTDLTPPNVNITCCPPYGLPAFDIDPGDPRTIYVCVDVGGMFKTTDGGTSWKQLGTDNQDQNIQDTTTFLDSPIAVKVDPNDPNHLYATEGVRGRALGFWVSTNGGDSWVKPKGFSEIAKTTTNDVTWLAVDPMDFKHILVGSHSQWPGKSNAGFVESRDGGETWIVHDPQPSWPNGSIGLHFLYAPELGIGDNKTWLVATDGDGFWKTKDAGATWTQVSKDVNIPHGGQQIYYSKVAPHYLYAGAHGFPARSKDNGDTWEKLGDNGLINATYYSLYGDGTTLYTSVSYTGDNAKGMPLPWMVSPEGDGAKWTEAPGGQTFSDGPLMQKFDAANNIMYSSNWGAGFLAYKVR
jgi:photosystem II stability/assembly factor-like uncharacterized protein